MAGFTLCQTCRRHVRAGDESCPFCGAAITSTETSSMRTAKGASRAVLYALATATSVATLACESPRGPSAPNGGSTADAGVDAAPTNTAPPVDTNYRPPNMPYGCVFPDGACTGELV